jgi:hypothetical protein
MVVVRVAAMAAAMVHRQHGIEINYAAPGTQQSDSLSMEPPARPRKQQGMQHSGQWHRTECLRPYITRAVGTWAHAPGI